MKEIFLVLLINFMVFAYIFTEDIYYFLIDFAEDIYYSLINLVEDIYYSLTNLIKKKHQATNKVQQIIEENEQSFNPDVFNKIQEIEKQMTESAYFSAANKEQWTNTIKPMLIETISKKQLNEKNEKKVMDILNTVSENINKSEIDFADIETAATLSSLESFMSMNGW